MFNRGNLMSRTRVRKVNRQSPVLLFLIVVVALVVIIACSVRTMSLSEQSKQLSITETSLENQLNEAQAKTEELEEREKYMQTKKYIEDEAKNKLGLVNKDEIVIKPKEDDE